MYSDRSPDCLGCQKKKNIKIECLQQQKNRAKMGGGKPPCLNPDYPGSYPPLSPGFSSVASLETTDSHVAVGLRNLVKITV